MPDNFRVHISSSGAPFVSRGLHIPMYEKDLPEARKPQSIKYVHNDVLELWIDEHKKKYDKIWDGVGLGVVVIADEDRKYIEERQNWKVFVRWIILSEIDPSELTGARYDILNVLAGMTRMHEDE